MLGHRTVCHHHRTIAPSHHRTRPAALVFGGASFEADLNDVAVLWLAV
jgi:hypothetical protein